MIRLDFATWKAEYEPRIYEDSGAECFDHEEHEIGIAKYVDPDGQPVNYAIECLDCHMVLADEEVTEDN